MDVANLKPGERTIEILHPGTGLPLGIDVRLVSIDDDRLRKVRRSITDERMKLEQRGKAFKSDDIEENAKKLLFTAALGWKWYNPTGNEGDDGYDADAMPELNGEVPEFNQKNFFAMLDNAWFSSQLNEALGETKDFFANSRVS